MSDYKGEGTTLLLGDCLDRMKEIPDESIDAVITSPPYNMNLRIRNGKYVSRQIVKELTTKYDDFDDNLPMDDYFEFNKKVLNECLRVSDLVFYNIQILTGNKPALFKIMGEFHDKIKELIVWDKVNAQPAIGKNILNSQFELILVLQNSKPESRAFDSAQFERGTLPNLWEIKRGKKISNKHGAVFPEELVEKIVGNFTKEGDVVLDPFLGTGTTGVVSTRMGRKIVGIEMSESYFELAKSRILGYGV